MPGHEESEHFPLVGQPLGFGPFIDLRPLNRLSWSGILEARHKESVLAARGLALPLLPELHGSVQRRHHLRAPHPQRIHGARFNQALDDAFVEEAEVNVLAEFEQAIKTPEFPSRL